MGFYQNNIDELLPTIPQNRLNTYSGMEEYEADWKDCHWTTINFFNRKVDERYYNLPDLLSFINDISDPLRDSQLKFGDIICIFDKNNELVHSCIYIAENLTLTKNGRGNLKPFVFSNIDKTISIYGEKAGYLSRTIADTYTVKLLFAGTNTSIGIVNYAKTATVAYDAYSNNNESQ